MLAFRFLQQSFANINRNSFIKHDVSISYDSCHLIEDNTLIYKKIPSDFLIKKVVALLFNNKP